MSTQQTSALSANFVNAVVSSVQEVLTTMAGMDISFKEARAQEDYVASGDISAVIGLVGENGEGMFAISLTRELAGHIVSKLLGVSISTLTTDDRCDGVGEVINMISGSVKAKLASAENSTYKLSLPTIILGNQHEVYNRPRNNPYLNLVFSADGQEFTIQVSFKKAS
jgi:chemotaxis protein CheX